jgi:hypothetical protein
MSNLVSQVPAPTRATSGVIQGQVTAAAIASAGSGGTNGTATVTGTTGSGVPFQAAVTISGGAITAINAITVAGQYTAPPTNPAAEPVTGGGLTGATLNLTIASLATEVAPANPARRNYTFQPVSVTSHDWSLSETPGVSNPTYPVVNVAGCNQVSAMSSTVAGEKWVSSSPAAVYAYNDTPFAAFTANEW